MVPTVIVGVLDQSLSARGATLIVASGVALLALVAAGQNLNHNHE